MPPADLPRYGDEDVLRRRMRIVAPATLIVLLAGWAAWFYPFDDLLDRSGTPLGGDYAMFYVAGQVVLDGDAHRLYDQREHARRLNELFPGLDGSGRLPFRYPPFVALLMAPLAELPYGLSYCVFTALSCCAWWSALRILAARLKIMHGKWREPIWWIVAGWPVALEALMGGQASMFGLLILAGTVALLLDDRPIWAGGVLALSLYKPSLLALFAFGCAVKRPRILAGAVPVAAALVVMGMLAGGWQATDDYAQLTGNLAGGAWSVPTPDYKLHGLAPWLAMALPAGQRALACGLGMVAALGIAWRWRTDDGVDPGLASTSLGMLVAINALCGAYVPIYDLTLLLAGGLLIADGAVQRLGENVGRSMGAVQLCVAALYFGPHVSQFLARLIGVQLFPQVLMAVLAWLLWREWKRSRAIANPSPPGGFASAGRRLESALR